ncbi:MAG: LCP family protein [Actinomycetota bacterium]|nr:LCP family protein [Actinomycetota bacterium]
MATAVTLSTQDQAGRVRFRRALTLLVMTLLLPGSAQLVAGNPRLGRLALRVLAGTAAVFVLTVGVGLLWPSVIAAALFDSTVLGILRVVLVALALGWAVLFVDAWRLGAPLALAQRYRLTVFSVNGALCAVASGALLFSSHLVAVHRSLIVDMFDSVQQSSVEDGRYNVLLLGGDAGGTRSGIRPDSITVASIDEDTGRTVLLGLPRNLENAPFPPGTPMHKAYPAGFTCDGCYLNAVYTWATDHRAAFDPSIDDVGAWATARTVEEITGLKINYHVIVDMRGFRDLVDAVGGVTVTVAEPIPIGGGGSPITGWIPPGRQHLDGFETLWFARSRETTDDYSRMARQKCVLNAMLQQLRPHTVLTRFQDLADASKRVVHTDIPASELSTFLELAGKAKALPVATVSFVPPRVRTYDPDYDAIRALVDAAIARAEAADEPDTANAGDPVAPHRQHPGREQRRDQRGDDTQSNSASDLRASCA